VNGLCPECGNPPEYHSFCTLCCQLFRQPRELQPPERPHAKTTWGNPALRARVASLSAGGLGARKIAELMGMSVESVKGAMTYYGLFAHPRGPRRPRRKICEVA
jgi:hypothetical protein